MPSKLILRDLKENSYYHVFNSATSNKDLFREDGDYETFLYYLYLYTADPSKVLNKYPKLPKRLISSNLFGQIYIVSYVLLPSRFHIVLKQRQSDAISKFMKQLVNAYSTYYNKKYKQKGSIFNGRYKSIRLESEYLVAQISRFVHLKPSISGKVKDPKDYKWSSLTDTSITTSTRARFDSESEYFSFNIDKKSYDENFSKIEKLIIDK